MDYTVVLTDPKIADYFLNNPGVRELVRYIDAVLGFFVVETKSEKVKLHDCLPQVLAQLYASATKLKKNHVRGTLTNGYEWLFIVVAVNPGGRGASYMTSIRSYSAAPQEIGGDTVVHGDQADMIAGILASWLRSGEDDWFTVGS